METMVKAVVTLVKEVEKSKGNNAKERFLYREGLKALLQVVRVKNHIVWDIYGKCSYAQYKIVSELIDELACEN